MYVSILQPRQGERFDSSYRCWRRAASAILLADVSSPKMLEIHLDAPNRTQQSTKESVNRCCEPTQLWLILLDNQPPSPVGKAPGLFFFAMGSVVNR